MYSLHVLRSTRTQMVSILDKLSLRSINKIPLGFNNNIYWNIAHCVATQQLLNYKLSSVDMKLPDSFIDTFRKGTTGKATASPQDVEDLKEYLFSTVDLLEKDLKEGVFKSFHEYTTSYGATLKNIEESVEFNTAHEALHLGVCMAMIKAL